MSVPYERAQTAGESDSVTVNFHGSGEELSDDARAVLTELARAARNHLDRRHTDDPPALAAAEHPFVLFAREHARTGSLREIFYNWIGTWIGRGEGSLLPEGDTECAAVIAAAVAAYSEATRAADAADGA